MSIDSNGANNLLKQLIIRMAGTVLAVTLVPAFAQEFITVQSTTSTQNSGLYEHLLPAFTAETGIEVRVVAVGTGQAIRNAERCNGDVLLVHAKAAEEKFVERGFGGPRHDLMYNDFVLVGPEDDPAGTAGLESVTEALKRIAAAKALFASRGDDSGTHKKELQLWSAANIDPVPASGSWYREMGSGMGATLNAGVGMGAYVLVDRASWLSFGNKRGFAIAVEGDERLFNQYGVIPVSKNKCPNVKAEHASNFIDWLLSEKGQGAIAAFRIDGKQLFFPNAADRSQ